MPLDQVAFGLVSFARRLPPRVPQGGRRTFKQSTPSRCNLVPEWLGVGGHHAGCALLQAQSLRRHSVAAMPECWPNRAAAARQLQVPPA